MATQKDPKDKPAAKDSTDKTKVANAAVALDLLEEDDEFEEFPAEDWNAKDEDKDDKQLWEDDWDDDTVEDDFAKQLRAELEKQNQPQPMAQ